jgi:RHS repeat-associated protein
MKVLAKKCGPLFSSKYLLGIMLLLFLASKVQATEEPYINELKGPQVAVGSLLTVSDEKFNSPAAWSLIDQHISVDDIISFEINFDTSIYFYDQPFACTVNFKIYIYGNQSDTSQITDSTTYSNISLEVRYDTIIGKLYKGVALYKFKDVHKFKIRVLSITSAQLSPIPAIFRLKSQIVVNRQYDFEDNSTDITRFSVVNGNQLKLEWTPSNYPGAQEFDLEYTFIDKYTQIAAAIEAYETGGNYEVPADTLAKWFKNNSSRITTSGSSYLINVTYDSGYILFRIRGVQLHYPDNVRWEGNWNYSARQLASECSEDCPSGVVLFGGHEQNLNWQFSVSFAEDGKSKHVISYYDGSLRTRQSVTINNTDNKSMVQESIYDALGRPAVSILPAVANDSTIHYFRGFNRNSANTRPYSFADLLYGGCSTVADSLSHTSGAGQYYSGSNSFQGLYHHAKYTPDAQGYPFAVTEYIADNTGRVKALGGVGAPFQLGSGHEMKYFYGKPTQTELDRLFGSEAGLASHYLKNMMVDANGTISVKYIDASGNTVATAVAGLTAANLHSLPSNNEETSVRVANDLITPSDFTVSSSDYSLTASATFLAPVTGDYVFKYRVDPLQYTKFYGPGKDSTICNNCYYDLEVLFKDDCNNLLARDTVSAGNIFDTACNPLPAPIEDSVTVSISNIGEYYVTYVLRVSRDALDFYDSTHLVENSDIKKLNYFLLDELKRTDFTGCFNVCETCLDELGDKPEFLQRFKVLYVTDSIYFGETDSLWILSLYDELYSHCQSIQAGCGVNVCDEKLALLKMDVSPGGQYALYDDNYTLLEPAINILARRDEVPFFVDELGNRDSLIIYNTEGDDSVKVDVMEVDDSTFIKNWKDIWADELVKFHPEYCHYLWCVANSNSFEFDRDIDNWEDADSAMAKGWFDPDNYKALLDADPFFMPGANGFSLRNSMGDSLRLFSRTLLGLSQQDKNILQFIDVVLYCNQQYNGWDACHPDSACRSRNREWFMYKQLYLNLKQRFYESARRASSDPVFANCVNCYIGSDLATTPCFPATDFVTYIYNGAPAEHGGCFSNSPRVDYTGTAPMNHDIVLNLTLFNTLGGDTTVNVVVPANSNGLRIDCVPELYNYFYEMQWGSGWIDSVSVNRVICTPLFIDIPSSPFVDSTCNYSCPDGIYADGQRDSVSYHIEHGTGDNPPDDVPAGYENCKFYPLFNLNVAGDSSCVFTNVWVCVKDSTAPTCQPQAACGNIPPSVFTVTDIGGYYCSFSPCEINPVFSIATFHGQPLPYTYNLHILVNDTVIIRQLPQGYTSFVLYEIGRGEFVGYVGTPEIIEVTCDSSSVPPLICDPFVNPPSICPDNPNAELYHDKIRRYPEYVNPNEILNNLSSSNPQAGTQEADQSVLDECHANCEAQADIWINSLRRCVNGDTEYLLDVLKYYFIDICSKACSVDRPFGASSIPLDITADYHSFEEAMAGILGSTFLSDSCAVELLSAPYPFDKQPVVADNVIMQTDYAICQKLGQYKTTWQTSGFTGSFHAWMLLNYPNGYTLDSLELDDMVNSCTNCNGILKNDIVLPVIFDPKSSPCISCDSAQVVLAAFNVKFPAIDSTDDDYQTLFTNFFNHRLGFSLTYVQYKAFLDSCANPSFTYKLCNQPETMEDTLDTDSGCMADLFATALTNATNTYIAYIDSVRKDFRDAWMTKCLNVQPRLGMTADLYEYHYTLYYYDQSNLLVKTIPPQGIDLLGEGEISQVQYFRLLQSEGCYQYSDSVKLNNNGQVDWNIGSAFESQPYTLEGVINLTSHADQVVLSKVAELTFLDTLSTAYYVQIGFTVNIINNKLELILYGAGESDDPVTIEYVQKTAKAVSVLDINNLLPSDQWRHIAIQYTGIASDPIRAYINGQQIALQLITNELEEFQPVAYASTLVLGAHNSPNLSLPGKLRGSLKNLRIYDRLLPSDEIRQNAFNVCQLPSNQANLLFWSALNTAKDNFVPELIGQGNGVLSGITWTAAIGTYPEHRLPTVFQYNSLNQIVQQYSPDGDTVVFFYDRLGRMTASQNKEQKDNTSYNGSANRFNYTTYDELGRIVESGEKSNPSNDIRNIDMLDTIVVKSWLESGVNRQVAKTIYDEPVNINIQTSSTSRKRVTASVYLENATDTEGDSTIYSYDINGNVKTLIQHIKTLVAADPDNGRKRFDYDYDLVSAKVNRISYQHGKGDQFYYKYDFDADLRVTRSYTSRDKLIWIEDASYTYYLHGPLARTELGQYKVQGVDYAYTLQRWLKGINSDSLSAMSEMANDGKSGTLFARVSRDVYGFKLTYYNGDYIPVGGVNATAFANKNYNPSSALENTGNEVFNGNITSATLSLSKLGNGRTIGYSYGYDQLNRLVEMRQHKTGGEGSWDNNDIMTNYSESVAYDANGNILKYLRKGTEATPDMDSLNYNYNRDGNGNIVNNRLNHIRESINSANYAVDIDNQSVNNYSYDKIGNLTRDVAENVDTIRWTTTGKINRIVKSSGSAVIEYAYDPSGNRISKTVNINDTIHTVFYIRDTDGLVFGVYHSKGGTVNWKEQHLIGTSRLGIWHPDSAVSSTPPVVDEDPIYDSLMLGSRTYELVNQLGNVLATISDKKIGNDSSGIVNFYFTEVLSQSDYYPGGMDIPGRSYTLNAYRYAFNGKEKDTEAPVQYDYGFRIYDPRIVRFKSVDPLTHSYPWFTPYQFAGNSPILNIDVDGLENAPSQPNTQGNATEEKFGDRARKMIEEAKATSARAQAFLDRAQKSNDRVGKAAQKVLNDLDKMEKGNDQLGEKIKAQKAAIEQVRKDIETTGAALFNTYDKLIYLKKYQLALMEGPQFTLGGSGKVTGGAQIQLSGKLNGVQGEIGANFTSVELTSGAAGYNPEGNSPGQWNAYGNYAGKDGVTKYEQGASVGLTIPAVKDVGLKAEYKNKITDYGDGSPVSDQQFNLTAGLQLAKSKNADQFKNKNFGNAKMPSLIAPPGLNLNTMNIEKKFYGIDLGVKAAFILGIEINFKIGFYSNVPTD